MTGGHTDETTADPVEGDDVESPDPYPTASSDPTAPTASGGTEPSAPGDTGLPAREDSGPPAHDGTEPPASGGIAAELSGPHPDGEGRGGVRLAVRKTYKLYVGGAFPRSESGRTYPVHDPEGAFVANVARASRKDVRDAVVAARKAFVGWSGRTGYNRGQILYRVAEMLDGRRSQFADELVTTEGVPRATALAAVDAAVDRWVWYAGWADKLAQVTGAANPVAGPFLNHSAPEPTGVIGVLAPPAAPLLGLVSVVAPVIVTGNTCVVLASPPHPLAAVTLAEVLATSDLPGGVVNVLTGQTAELGPWLAAHGDVDGLDLTGADPADAVEWERAAADNLKRVRRPDPTEDWAAEPALSRMTTFTETKTTWHPLGL